MNVLLVDDDENTAILFRLLAEGSGSKVCLRVLETGEAAMAYIAGQDRFSDRQAWPVPDLMVLDLKLQGAGGFDVLECCRRSPEFRAVPVVVFTGSMRAEDREQSLAKGADWFLNKPIDLKGFRTAVAEMLALGEKGKTG